MFITIPVRYIPKGILSSCQAFAFLCKRFWPILWSACKDKIRESLYYKWNPKKLLCDLEHRISNQISSSFSVPTFLTLGFQIFAGIHVGAPAGFFTCFRSPVKMCTFFVPLYLSLISVMPLLAAFKAACLGDLPVKTPSSLPLASLRAKCLASFSAVLFPPNSKNVFASTYF
jgi:hypothetical protein